MGVLKDQWNKFCCVMDGLDTNLFASVAVDDALRQKGWKISVQHYVVPTTMCPGAVTFKNITDPAGERVTTNEQRKAYFTARKEAARHVYGIK